MTRVRPAQPADAEALSALAAETFPLACPPGTDPAGIAAFIAATFRPEHFLAALADPDRIVLVAEPDGAGAPGEPGPAGLLGYTLSRFGAPADPEIAGALTTAGLGASGGVAELSKCYVRQVAHGGAVAHALMTATLAAFAERGARTAWLGVNQRNERAQRFYAKHAFGRVGTKQFLVGAELHDDFVLARAL